MNRIQSYLFTAPHVSNWLDSLIGPSGLLLVVSPLTYSQFQFQFCWWGWKKKLVINLIGPSGLLLVVSHLFAVPVSVLLVGLEKMLVIKTWM
jgi:hypothetical protein